MHQMDCRHMAIRFSFLLWLFVSIAVNVWAEGSNVCVPAAGGVGWSCGDKSHPPTAAALPQKDESQRSTPPVYLIDPAKVFGQGPDRPARSVQPVATSKPSAGNAPSKAAPTTKPKTVAAINPSRANVAPTISSMPVAATNFAQLNPTHYVIQINAASDPNGLLAQVDTVQSALNAEAFVLAIKRDGRPWWLLVAGDYSTIEAARAARDRLPTLLQSAGAWPRRIEPLQTEVRSAH
jgi:septal ring-binding cell division protein DamX